MALAAKAAEPDSNEALLGALLGEKAAAARPALDRELVGSRPWSVEEARPLLEAIAAVDTKRGESAFARAAEKELALGHEAQACALLERAGEAGRSLLARIRAPSIEVTGEAVRARNGAALARPFELEPFLDDLALAFRASDEPLDAPRLAAGHVTGEPVPLASASGPALLLETSPEGARAVLVRGVSLRVEQHERGLSLVAWESASGAPLAGSALVVLGASELRDGRPRRFSSLAALPLDPDGAALAPVDARFSEALVLVRTDDGRGAWQRLPLPPSARDERPRLLVHWERALVRPGETLRAIVLARRKTGADLVPLLAGERIEVVLLDSSDKELARKELAVDRFGAATFEAPAARGALHLEARIEGEPARIEGSPVLVAEPRAGTLELSLGAPAWVEPGEPLHVAVSARDPLGAPVLGRVRWRLVAGTVSEGTIATDGSGNATLELPAVPGDARLDAFLDDATGREAAASARIAASAGSPRLVVETERSIVGVNEEASFLVDARGLEGGLDDVKGAEFLARPGGAAQTRADLATKDGRTRAALRLPAPGPWDIALVATPSHALLHAFAVDMASGAGATDALDLELAAEKPSFFRGDLARFLVRAPAGTRVLLLARDERGLLRADFPRFVSPGVFSLQLDATWAPGFELEAVATIRGKLETARVRASVAPLGCPLEVEVKPDKARYKPEEKALVRLHVQETDSLPARGGVVFLSLEEEDAARAALRASETEEADLLLARRHEAAPAPPTGFVVLGTDDGGNAQAQLAIPRQGRWRVRALAVASDGKVATGEAVLAARARVGLDLGAPEEASVGDTVELVLVARNEGEKPHEVDFTLASSAAGVLALEGEAKRRLAIPAHGEATLRVRAVAKKPGRARIDGKIAGDGEDQTVSASVLVTGPRFGWLGVSTAAVGSDATAAAGSVTLVVPPGGTALLVRVDTPASVLGDIVSELVRPGPGAEPALAFVPALLARRALDARGMKWEEVAKRVGVDRIQELVAGEAGKGPRDPRRSPLFVKPRLDALVKEGLEDLEARFTPAGWSWRPGGPADLEETATAVEALALARELGALPAPELLDRGCAALEKLADAPVAPSADAARSSPRVPLATERAHAALALVLAGKAALLDKLEPGEHDREPALLLAIARLRARKDAPGVRERASLLLAGAQPSSDPAATLARELELATLLDGGAGGAPGGGGGGGGRARVRAAPPRGPRGCPRERRARPGARRVRPRRRGAAARGERVREGPRQARAPRGRSAPGRGGDRQRRRRSDRDGRRLARREGRGPDHARRARLRAVGRRRAAARAPLRAARAGLGPRARRGLARRPLRAGAVPGGRPRPGRSHGARFASRGAVRRRGAAPGRLRAHLGHGRADALGSGRRPFLLRRARARRPRGHAPPPGASFGRRAGSRSARLERAAARSVGSRRARDASRRRLSATPRDPSGRRLLLTPAQGPKDAPPKEINAEAQRRPAETRRGPLGDPLRLLFAPLR